MEAKFAVKNGKIIKSEDATISVFNKSMFFDFAVYSNIKVVNRKMFMPELEIDTLIESAKSIELKHGFTKLQIMEWAESLIKKCNLNDAIMRLLLIGAESIDDVILFIFPVGLTFYPEKFYKQGVKLITFKGERFMPQAKTKNMLMSYIAFKKAQENGALDALLVDNDGNITEGTRCSFFAIKGNTLIAPPKEHALSGITRKIILELAPRILEVKEWPIRVEKLKDYDELFISSTSMNIIPVNQIDNAIICDKAGEKVKELQRLYKELTSNNFNKKV